MSSCRRVVMSSFTPFTSFTSFRDCDFTFLLFYFCLIGCKVSNFLSLKRYCEKIIAVLADNLFFFVNFALTISAFT